MPEPGTKVSGITTEERVLLEKYAAIRVGRIPELVGRLLAERDRAVFLAEHLFQMVPREVWRDHGADDGQGHYEGDYHAEQVAEEIAELKARCRP